MLAVGVITLFLTAFVFVFYSYLANHSEHDVSFFLSVSIISMIMNLFTNMGGVYVLSFLYLGIDVLFIALGFAVSVEDSVAFYRSIVPWFKDTFTNGAVIGWQVLSAVLFPAGIALFFVNYRSNNVLAKACGKAAALGLVLVVWLLWMILGIAL